MFSGVIGGMTPKENSRKTFTHIIKGGILLPGKEDTFRVISTIENFHRI